jgi:hypothetical protein
VVRHVNGARPFPWRALQREEGGPWLIFWQPSLMLGEWQRAGKTSLQNRLPQFRGQLPGFTKISELKIPV